MSADIETRIAELMALPYTVVTKLDEDGDVMAAILEWQGCLAHGAHLDEALDNLQESKIEWLRASLLIPAVPIPPPNEDITDIWKRVKS